MNDSIATAVPYAYSIQRAFNLDCIKRKLKGIDKLIYAQ